MTNDESDAPSRLTENAATNYLRETRAELMKVTWPTRQEWLRLSAIVLVVTAVMAVILGLAEAVGAELMSLFLKI